MDRTAVPTPVATGLSVPCFGRPAGRFSPETSRGGWAQGTSTGSTTDSRLPQTLFDWRLKVRPEHTLTGRRGGSGVGAVGRLIPAGTDGALGEEEAEQTLTGFFTGKGVSGTDGRLDLGRFAAGEYTLRVTRGSAEATLEGIVLQEGAPAELQLQLQ